MRGKHEDLVYTRLAHTIIVSEIQSGIYSKRRLSDRCRVALVVKIECNGRTLVAASDHIINRICKPKSSKSKLS